MQVNASTDYDDVTFNPDRLNQAYPGLPLQKMYELAGKNGHGNLTETQVLGLLKEHYADPIKAEVEASSKQYNETGEAIPLTIILNTEAEQASAEDFALGSVNMANVIKAGAANITYEEYSLIDQDQETIDTYYAKKAAAEYAQTETPIEKAPPPQPPEEKVIQELKAGGGTFIYKYEKEDADTVGDRYNVTLILPPEKAEKITKFKPENLAEVIGELVGEVGEMGLLYIPLADNVDIRETATSPDITESSDDKRGVNITFIGMYSSDTDSTKIMEELDKAMQPLLRNDASTFIDEMLAESAAQERGVQSPTKNGMER